MLAAPADPGRGLPDDGVVWAYEVKWDGMRVLADIAEGRVRLSSRTGNDVTAAFPELADLGRHHPDVLLDGEVVVLRDGAPSLAALADRMHVRDERRGRVLARTAPSTFVVFDVLRLYGVDLTARPWQERREVLERLGSNGRAWHLSPVYDDRDALVAATLEPFVQPPPRMDAAGAVWVEPQIVVEVRHKGHTEGGRLREPVFRGIRSDLDPATVTDEYPGC